MVLTLTWEIHTSAEAATETLKDSMLCSSYILNSMDLTRFLLYKKKTSKSETRKQEIQEEENNASQAKRWKGEKRKLEFIQRMSLVKLPWFDPFKIRCTMRCGLPFPLLPAVWMLVLLCKLLGFCYHHNHFIVIFPFYAFKFNLNHFFLLSPTTNC